MRIFTLITHVLVLKKYVFAKVSHFSADATQLQLDSVASGKIEQQTIIQEF
jgi:hypothetical protein